MKTISEIINQEPIYLHNWYPDKRNELIIDFEGVSNIKDLSDVKIKKWDKYNILFASYGEDNYEGDAFVLLEKEGKLYEVNGGHCSCYGLEGQFIIEETTIENLEHRLINGKLGVENYSDNQFAVELKNFLGIL